MAKSDARSATLRAPSPSRQIAFHQLLVAARKLWLDDALADALSDIDPATIKREVLRYAAPDVLKVLAASGIRDEFVFPTPVVLRAKPTLVGYYRLLLGASQKTFYSGATGMAALKSMELKGSLTERQIVLLPEFCRTMGEALAELIRQISPVVTPRDVKELRLLTLGSQFQGANNVKIGQQATADVFVAIAELLEPFIVERTDYSLVVQNASARRAFVSLASDPDIRIFEEFNGEKRKKVAIEIKGGTDKSNAQNRAGEAEKSHQKAKNEGFMDFWTIIAKKGLDVAKLKKESPTSRLWFDVAQVLGRTGEDWDDFRSRFAEAIGVPLE